MSITESPIAQNRAEELGFDIWDDFVIPPFYDSLDLLAAKKPRVIVGGRGCGKTSLLRYLCHQTQFSNKRSDISTEDIKNIGIYWRIDTQFAKMLSRRGFDENSWNRAFGHLSVLVMCQEVLKSLESISNSTFQDFGEQELNNFDFSILNSFSENVPNTFSKLRIYIRREINHFQTWAGSIRTVQEPIFLPLNFVVELITEIKTQNKLFKDTNYLVYIDEYENLLLDQQRLINTWLKHSESPLIFNLAMKPNSFIDRKTVGNEAIVETHDYREFNLEEFYAKINFEVFASEILFLRLWKNDATFKIPIIPEELKSTDEKNLLKRRSVQYTKRVLSSAKEFLPGMTVNEIAKEVFSDQILSKRLKDLLLRTVQKEEIDKLFLPDFPQAGVIIPALLARGISTSDLLIEIEKLRSNVDNKFTGSTSWIHNNIFGCLLLIYEPLVRFCPLYAGFEAFCMMSKTNLRHFLELCNKSIVNETLETNHRKITRIGIKSQAVAAKQASTTFLREVKNFGNSGNQLHTFVLRLGTYFSYSQKKLTQSEPEQNHFYVKGTMDTDLSSFIREAVKWSVLYENRITKQKGGENKLEADDFEYLLNPIYAPYFHISFRKKRSVHFDVEHTRILIFGNYEQFESLLKHQLKLWKISSQDSVIDLFSQIDQKT